MNISALGLGIVESSLAETKPKYSYADVWQRASVERVCKNARSKFVILHPT